MKGRSRRLSLSQTAYLLTTLSIQHIEIYSAEYISAKIKISALKNYVLFMLWFNFILGSNFTFLCFKLIIIHYNTQNKIKKN